MPQLRQAWQWASSTSGQEARVLDLVWSTRVFIVRRALGTIQLAWYERALKAARLLGQRTDEAVASRSESVGEASAAMLGSE